MTPTGKPWTLIDQVVFLTIVVVSLPVLAVVALVPERRRK